MLKEIKNIALAIALVWIVPVLFFSLIKDDDIAVTEDKPQTLCSIDTTAPPEVERTIRVLKSDNTVEQMEIEDYVTCVVLREMPPEFEPEALKAQAVVARTYTLRRCLNSNNKHQNADVCVSPACCQGFYDKEEYLKDGGTEQLISKVEEAVLSTRSQVLLYNGELIDATYFSCSGGRTEDAVAVWGTDIPYLQSTDSPGEENAARFTDSAEFTLSEFAKLLQLDQENVSGKLIDSITYTRGGGVDEITISGKTFKGTDIRKLLGIRSTAFTIQKDGNSIVVTTKGFGHRVGMSQYGADAMAVKGSDYTEILNHYYKDVVLSEYSDN